MSNQKNQLSIVTIALIGLSILTIIILLPYLSPLVLALVFAIACAPIYKEILKVVKFRWVASLLVTFLVLVIILIPLAFFGRLVLGEAIQVYGSLNQQGGIGSGQGLITFIKDRIDQLVPASWGVVDTASYAKGILAWLVGILNSVFSNIAQGIIAFIFSLLLLFYLLKDWKDLKEFLILHSPLGEEITEMIFGKIHGSINAVIRGSLIVAIVDGIATGIGFALFGIPSPALWGGLTVIAALIPTFGSAVVVIPGILYLAFSNAGINAVGLAVWAIATVGMMDNFVGPQLVKRGTKIYSVFILLGVLGGVSVFGLVGFVIGPMVFALLFAMLDIYKTIWQDKLQSDD